MSSSAPERANVGPPPNPPPRRLRPSEVEAQFFEFFPKSAQRQVLLLDRLVDLLVHYLRDSRRKKLCTSEHGSCELCELAASSPDVEPCQAEYYAPAYVRRTGGPFEQKVVVFPAASAIKLQELIPLDAMKGKLVEVTRKPSRVLAYKQLSELPRSIPSSTPKAFDVLPFIRARYGLPDDPNRPMQILPPLRVDVEAKPADRPARIRISRQDADELSSKTVEELREYLAKFERNGMASSAERVRTLLVTKGVAMAQASEPEQAEPEPVEAQAAATSPPASPPPPVSAKQGVNPGIFSAAEPVSAGLRNNERGMDTMGGALGAVLGKQGVNPGSGAKERREATPSPSMLPDISVESAQELLQHFITTGTGTTVEMARLRAVIERGEQNGEAKPSKASPITPIRIFAGEDDPIVDEHGMNAYERSLMTKGTAEHVCDEIRDRVPASQGSAGKAVP